MDFAVLREVQDLELLYHRHEKASEIASTSEAANSGLRETIRILFKDSGNLCFLWR